MQLTSKTKILTNGAISVAIATVLSFVQIGIWINGGSVTLLSALPIFIFSYKYGLKWGVFCGFIFGVLQMLIGVGGLKGITLTTFVMAIILDYFLAYACYGFTGIFKNKKTPIFFVAGCLLAFIGRFICHFLSGVLIWGSLTTDGIGAVTYSFMYNLSYMLPETIVTVVASYFAYNILKKSRLI